MNTPATILLFDIDGTLLTCGGGGRHSMKKAFAEQWGAREGVFEFTFAGGTDYAIARQALQRAGLSDNVESIQLLLNLYLKHLAITLEEREGFRVLPGVESLLDRLAQVPGLAIGLGTGNLEAGAQLKLARGRLNDRFAFGGFGSDDEDRSRLIAMGFARGAQQLERPLSACRRIVIGDTIRDVSAALANDAKCLAVTTGHHDAAALKAAGATWVVDSLQDARVWSMLLHD